MLKFSLVFLVFCIALVCGQTSVSVTDLSFSDDYTLYSNGSSIFFTITFGNDSFGTDLLNGYVEDADSNLNDTTWGQLTIELSNQVYTAANATVTYGAPTAYNGSAVVACQNYSNINNPASGYVFGKVNLGSFAGTDGPLEVKVKVQFNLYSTCSADNFGGSDIWIWIIVIVAVVLVILVIIGAVAGFLYWKKKQAGNYALYNDS